MPGTGSERLRLTVRLRLTLLYGSLFLAAGALLLSVNYALVRRSLPDVERALPAHRVIVGGPHAIGPAPGDILMADGVPVKQFIEEFPAQVRKNTLDQLLTQSVLALGLMGVLAVALGWLMAGRVLRPLHEITATARRLSQENLHERIGLGGPQDELRELADTFDAMLGRLDAAFESQRRFVADASHELRTPLSIIRTEVDVALRDPTASVEQFRAMGENVRDATERTERLLDSLLVLARSERGIEARERVDLAAEVTAALAATGVEAQRSLAPAVVSGDPALLGRLVGNLVENAARHGRGGVVVSTGVDGGEVVVRVANGGEVIDPEVVPSLFEPFRRLERTRSVRGVGLGLSIVRSVANAHGGTVRAEARPEGGLAVEVRLPAASRP
ncbi:MAG TPA: ATP-binding protein [Acidimicrobiales bacterium]|nr:ATP-binding protein [Acidimicrobiales bacterium]